MELNEVKCPLCGDVLTVTFVDIGEREPAFIMGLTCSCDGWLELEIDKGAQMAQHFGELVE